MEQEINEIAYMLKKLIPNFREGIVAQEYMEVFQGVIGLIDRYLVVCPTNEVENSAQLIEWRYMLSRFELAD